MKIGLKRTAENGACPPLFKVRDLVSTSVEARRMGGRVRVIGDCVRESFLSRGSAENPVLNQATVEYLLPGRQSAAFTSAFERLLDELVH